MEDHEMRWTELLLISSLIAEPALAQSNSREAAFNAIVFRAKMVRVALLANYCQLRSDSWNDKAQKIMTEEALDLGRKRSFDLIGEADEKSGIAFAIGAVQVAIAAASQEFSDYGDAACRGIEHSDYLDALDHVVGSK